MSGRCSYLPCAPIPIAILMILVPGLAGLSPGARGEPAVRGEAHRRERFARLHAIGPADAGASPGIWYGFRNGFQNRGVSPVAVRPLFQGAPAGRTPASHATAGIIWGTPVVDHDGNVYLGSADKVFYALGPDGSLRWSYTLPDAGDALVDSAATLAPGNLVVVPGGDGSLHGLDRQTGTRRFRFDAYHAGDHESGVTVNSFEGNVTLGPDGHLYAGSDNGHLYSVTVQGQERWNFKTGFMIWSAVAFAPDGSWLTFGSLDRRLYVLDPADGSLVARFKGGAEFKGSPAVGPDGRIYVGNSDFSFRCLELTRGTFGGRALRQRWSYPTGGEIYSSPAISGDRVVFGSHDGYLYCLGTSGELRWRYGIHSRISASPLITADGVVLVGAKNGKLYAIDLETGERIWSFRTAPGLRKVNLDSSPALDTAGWIHVGSYDGRIHRIPIEFPLRNAGDPRCDLDPGDDLPEFGGPLPAAGATLRYLDRQGRFHESAVEPVDPSSPLTFKLVVLEDGQFVPNAAIAVHGLEVRVDPPAPVETTVSSDSYLLNVFPGRFWKPAQTYRITVRGRYFHRKNPLVDLLKWWRLPRFHYEGTFTVPAEAGRFPAVTGEQVLRYAIRSMYVAQPEQLDTLIPAAMDGQAFIASFAFVDPGRGHHGLVLLPAYPRPDGVVIRPAPEKVFMMNGRQQGDSVITSGDVSMAAMGSTLSLAPIRFFGRLGPDHIRDGAFHATAPILGIKGNGTLYTGLSWSALDDLADPWLRLQAIGTLEGQRLPAPDVLPRLEESRWTSPRTLELTFSGSLPDPGPHLVTAAFWDPAGARLVAQATAALGEGSKLDRIVLDDPSLARIDRAGTRMRILLDGERVPGSP